MGQVTAPPRIFVKNRKIEVADINTLRLKAGDKWHDTQNGKVYFMLKKHGGGRCFLIGSVDAL